MRLVLTSLVIAIGLAGGAAGAAAAEPAGQAEAAKCRTAEVNPVTGHVMCIDPLGAAVEPAPAELAPPCKAEDSRGQWTWAPNCNPRPEAEQKEGM